MRTMRFAIWGAGTRGRNLRYFLESRAVAYIDNKPSLQGKMQDGLPILSFDNYLANGAWSDTWVVVTPRSFSEDIAGELKRRAFDRYFILQDAYENFDEYKLSDLIQRCIFLANDDGEVHLRGLDAFHAVLYDELLRAGKQPVIWIPQEKWGIEQKRRQLLKDWNLYRETDAGQNAIPDAMIFEGAQNLYANPAMGKLRDLYKGRRCFIIATGPSLTMEDLETLRKHHELCISMNGIYLAYPNTSWRPDVFVETDPLVIHDMAIIDSMDDVPYRIVSDTNMDFWAQEHPESVYRMHLFIGHDKDAENRFSEDLVEGCYGNGTVTNCCIQIAQYLGCTEAYLLGVDFTDSISQGEDNHFIKDYKSEVVQDYNSDGFYTNDLIQTLMYKGYCASRNYADTHPHFKIYNATRGGHLEVFERVDFDSLF